MKIALAISISLILLIIIHQDFKERLVSVILLPILSILALLWYFYVENTGLEVLKNVFFLTILILSTFLYFSLKSKRITNILTSYLGLGDILFLLAVTPFFGSQNYVIFIVSGFLITSFAHLSVLKFNILKDETIPLAGYLSIYMLFLLVIDASTTANLFTKQLINL